MIFNIKHFQKLMIVVFIILSTAFPAIVYDPDIEYQVMKTYHPWLTTRIYQNAYYYSRVFKLSVNDVCGIIKEESGGNTHAVSVASARGLMQIMAFHHKGTSSDLFDEQLNIYYGCQYYKWCLGWSKGNKQEALRCYNAGPNNNRANYRNWKYVDAILAHSRVTTQMTKNFTIVIR